VVSGPDGNVLVLRGEIDREAGTHLRAIHRLVATDPRPIVVDCTRVTFIDAGGLRVVLDVLEREPHDRLANVPPVMARLFRLIGRQDVLTARARHAVAVASYEGVDVVTAARAAEVFRLANAEGCAYDVVTVPFDPTTCVAPVVERRWRAVIVPPMDAWLGLCDNTPITRWLRSLTVEAVQLIGVGTGLFLLAAAGRLDGRAVAGGPSGHILAATARRATVCTMTTVEDGPVGTASDADGAVALCLAAVSRDYGDEMGTRVGARLRAVAGQPRAGHDRRSWP
jgi:anti-anti-sigma factor